MNIKPAQGRILLKKETTANITKSGFYLPETAVDAQKSLEKGKVIACGPWVEGIDCASVTEGSDVLYVKWSASEVEYNGEKYDLIRYEDVAAIINEQAL